MFLKQVNRALLADREKKRVIFVLPVKPSIKICGTPKNESTDGFLNNSIRVYQRPVINKARQFVVLAIPLKNISNKKISLYISLYICYINDV